MTEQERIISDFKVKCEEIIAKHRAEKSGNNTRPDNIHKEISDEANEVINRHSNMPNIDAEKLTKDIDKICKTYQNKQ